MIPVPIQILGIDTIQTIDYDIHHTIETETIRTIGIEVIQIIEINFTKTIDQETIYTTDLIINEPITAIIRDYKIIQIRNPSYNDQQRNSAQSPHRKINRYSDSRHKYSSNTPKHQRQINQVQTTEETNSDSPGIDDTKSTELQLNHITMLKYKPQLSKYTKRTTKRKNLDNFFFSLRKSKK